MVKPCTATPRFRAGSLTESAALTVGFVNRDIAGNCSTFFLRLSFHQADCVVRTDVETECAAVTIIKIRLSFYRIKTHFFFRQKRCGSCRCRQVPAPPTLQPVSGNGRVRRQTCRPWQNQPVSIWHAPPGKSRHRQQRLCRAY